MLDLPVVMKDGDGNIGSPARGRGNRIGTIPRSEVRGSMPARHADLFGQYRDLRTVPLAVAQESSTLKTSIQNLISRLLREHDSRRGEGHDLGDVLIDLYSPRRGILAQVKIYEISRVAHRVYSIPPTVRRQLTPKEIAKSCHRTGLIH